MPVAGGRGGGTNQTGRPPKDKDPIIKGPQPGTATAAAVLGGSSSTSSSSPGSSAGSRGGAVSGAKAGTASSSSSSASSSASSGYNSYLAAQNKAKDAAKNRYLEDAQRLNGQIAALAAALGPRGEFRDALDKRLKGVDEVLGEQTKEMLLGFDERTKSLDADQKNNEIAAGDSGVENDTNRVRERRSALGEAAAQGAGESDQLATQLMSLRNWEANQGEISRSYADSARSIVASRVDLRADTRTALQNMALEADSDKQQLWDDFWQQSSETQVALGNALGQQAEYYGLAKEQGAGKVKRAELAPLGINGTNEPKRGKLGDRRFDTTINEDYLEVGEEKGSRLGQALFKPGPKQHTEIGRAGDKGDRGKPGKGKPGQNGTKSQGGKGSIGIGKAMSEAEAASDAAFMAGTNLMGRAYDPQGVPKWLKGWGPDIAEPKALGSSLIQNARTTVAQKAPEGATLRKW